MNSVNSTAMPDFYAVIGNPIAHSKSPLIHNTFAQTLGENLVYERVLAPLGEFAATVDKLRAERGLRGLNITVPFKIDAYNYATSLTQRARDAGAINCLKFTASGDALGDNFDGIGLLRDVVVNENTALQGKRILILGAGGATRGLLSPFLAEKPASITVANRTLEKAQALARDWAAQGEVIACGYEALSSQTFDVILHATSATLSAQTLPINASLFAHCALAIDLTYGKGLTPFLALAKAAGVPRFNDGVGMLGEQAADAFEWWRGVRPPTAEVIKLLTVPLV